jgi:hypothetical protein
MTEEFELVQVGLVRPGVGRGLSIWVTALFVAAFLIAVWLVPERPAADCGTLTPIIQVTP